MQFSQKDIERFWSKVDKRGPDECWEWSANTDSGGYGLFKFDNKNLKAHRVSWVMSVGPIPEGTGWHGTVVRHRCDNRLCCNPTHLELGTQADNNRDCFVRNRRNEATGDRNGSRTKAASRPRGSRQWKSKLTETDVKDMIGMRLSGASTREIATKYGVSMSTAWKNSTGFQWKHVQTPTKESAS